MLARAARDGRGGRGERAYRLSHVVLRVEIEFVLHEELDQIHLVVLCGHVQDRAALLILRPERHSLHHANTKSAQHHFPSIKIK
jgi:hypothetical protein